MHIIHFGIGKINPVGSNGVSRVIYHQVKALRKLGHKVRIIGMVKGFFGAEFVDRGQGINVELYPMPSILNSMLNSENHPLTKAILSYENLDLVHLHGGFHPCNFVVAKILRKNKIPYIVTSHCGYSPDRLKNKWYTKIPYKYLIDLNYLNYSSAIQAICFEELSDLRRYGVSAPIFYLPNGHDPKQIPEKLNTDFFRGISKIDNHKYKIIFVGRLGPEKNIESLIRSVQYLPNDINKDVVLIIVGPDENRSLKKLTDIAEMTGIENQVFFAGPIYEPDKYHALASADIYIHPAFSDVVSLSAIEAMSLGKPCVITRSSYVSYYYKYDAFEMVEPWPDDIARGIQEIIKKKNKWPSIGLNAQRLVEGVFNWDRIAEKLTEVYKTVVDRHGQSSG